MCGKKTRAEAVPTVKEVWFELDVKEWNVRRADDGRQEQSRKKQKKQQQSPATDSWTVEFMTRQEKVGNVHHGSSDGFSRPWEGRVNGSREIQFSKRVRCM